MNLTCAFVLPYAVILGACTPSTFRISSVTPRPIVAQTPAMTGVALTIENTPEVLHASSPVRVDFVDVHAALRSGFAHGFGSDGSAGRMTMALTLHRLDVVDSRSVPASKTVAAGGLPIVFVHGGVHTSSTKLPPRQVVRLSYSAQLRDASGVIASASGDVHGTVFGSPREREVKASVTAAIEAMYVALSIELFERRTATLAPTPRRGDLAPVRSASRTSSRRADPRSASQSARGVAAYFVKFASLAK